MRRLSGGVAAFLTALAVVMPYVLQPLSPTPAGRAAGLYAQGTWGMAWQHSVGGGSPAWMLGPGGVPALAALLVRAGMPAERAVRCIVGLLYALGAVGMVRLAQSLHWPAPWAGLAFALAPGRWTELVRDGHSSHAAALAVLPFVPLLLGKRRPLPVAGSLVLLALFWLPRPDRGGAWPEAEFLLTVTAGWLAFRLKRLAPLLVCTGVFAAGLGWEVVVARPDRPREVSPAGVRWLAGHAAGEATLDGPAWFGINPVRRQAEQVIFGPDRPLYSVLWLEALGVTHVTSCDTGKYRELLEAEHQEAGGCAIYHSPARYPGPAVLVSRRQWQALPRLTSIYDRPALAAYVEWANRPEGAGFRWLGAREAEVRAEVGPEDMILVRQNAGAGWKAQSEGRAVTELVDPIGYLLLDPHGEGTVTIRLRAPWRAGSARSLPEHAVPYLQADSIVEGVRLTPPPFAPGSVVTVYGTGLGNSSVTRLLAGGRPAEILYAGESQINARLPGELAAGAVEMVAEVGGVRSNAIAVEMAR